MTKESLSSLQIVCNFVDSIVLGDLEVFDFAHLEVYDSNALRIP